LCHSKNRSIVGGLYFDCHGDCFFASIQSSLRARNSRNYASEYLNTSALSDLIFFDHFYDFGNVTEGEIVKHTFKFKNNGLTAVKITNTETSCGCTTASNALKTYAPNEEGEMEVVVDTVGKKGAVIKTVTVTMENNQTVTTELSLAMNLLPPPHPKREPLVNLNADARCKSCHLVSGKGQMGMFLYHRVCVQCHGKKGQGGSAHGFVSADWQASVKDADIRAHIVDGGSAQGMPSFVTGVTPPLDDAQVDSLVSYIRQLGK
jgi:mono/diheme cytochrome c family protein